MRRNVPNSEKNSETSLRGDKLSDVVMGLELEARENKEDANMEKGGGKGGFRRRAKTEISQRLKSKRGAAGSEDGPRKQGRKERRGLGRALKRRETGRNRGSWHKRLLR